MVKHAVSGLMPPEFITRMHQLLQDEAESYFVIFDAPPATGLWLNTMKCSWKEFQARSPFGLDSIPWTKDGFIVTSDSRPSRHPYHAAGLYYIQDPSAMAVVEILDPQPGERVLDLAAAPGGKTTHITARMQNQGLFVANEIHSRRVWDLVENLERWETRNAIVTNASQDQLCGHFAGFFDRVLVDAPCSGEGMFRRSEAARAEWSPELVNGCSRRQSAKLEKAAKLVSPGGWLVYATCTFSPEENEQVIAQFLQSHTEFDILSPPTWKRGYSPGRSDWVKRGINQNRVDKAVRLWPHHGHGDGHFIARLRHNGEGWKFQSHLPPVARFPEEAQVIWRQFYQENFWRSFERMDLSLVKSQLYSVPTEQPRIRNLRVIRHGWWLGTIKKNHFEPSHALALGENPAEAKKIVCLNSNEVQAYFRGETISGTDNKDGWVLVTFNGFPVGWGKKIGKTIKNHFPKR